jgi:hypothetical protein
VISLNGFVKPVSGLFLEGRRLLAAPSRNEYRPLPIVTFHPRIHVRPYGLLLFRDRLRGINALPWPVVMIDRFTLTKSHKAKRGA